MAVESLFSYDANTTTPQQLARKRALVQAMLTGKKTPTNWGEGVGAILSGLAAGSENRALDQQEAAGQASAKDALSTLFTGGQFPASTSAAGGAPMADGGASVPAGNAPANWENIKQGIFKGESGGDYNALFGFSNRPGKQFGNTKLTDMSVDQALAFADPSGPYGQFVKGQVGRVATPMGAYQVVGTTLKAAKNGLGLTGNEQMTPELQDRIGQWILANQGTGAWAGYRGPVASSPAVAANDAAATGQPVPAAPAQVASLDPSIGMAQASPVQMQPGPIPNAGPQQSAFIDRMTSPQSMTGGAPMPMQGGGPLESGPSIQRPSFVQAPQQVAQAAPQDLSQIPPMAGGTAGTVQPGQQSGPSLEVLMKAYSNPWLDDNQRQMVGMLLKQKLAAQDPSNQLDMDYKRAQIGAYKRKGGSLINAGNGNIYDPQTGSWLSAPAPDGEAPLFDGKSVQAQGLNYLVRTGELTREQAAQLAAGKTITDPSTGAITFMTPQGLVTQPGGGDGNGNGRNTLTDPKKPSDTEYATGIYADRMTNAGKIIDGLESEGTSLRDNFLNSLPLGNYMVPGGYQKFDQAQRDFVNAVLRRESGAVISDEEFANARKQYLPQPGDTPEVIAQKRTNRQIAIDGMRRAAGPSYNAGEQPPQGGNAGGGVKRLKFNPATGELE